MKRAILILSIIALVLGTACRKKDAPGGKLPPPSPAVAQAMNEMEQRLSSGDVQAQLQVLTQLLQAWVMSKNTFPEDVQEFVKAGTIAKLPTPPSGKKFAIDRQTIRVVLKDQ